MSGFTTSVTLKEMINKFPMRKEEEMSKKRKRRKVPKDKETDLPKKYLSGLKGSKRSARASLIKAMSSYKIRCKEYQDQCLGRGKDNGS